MDFQQAGKYSKNHESTDLVMLHNTDDEHVLIYPSI